MVRLIGADGSQLGIVLRADALRIAREKELDLVEVAPRADPPVCKLLDYGKFKYRQKKKRQSQRHHRARLKEIRVGMNSQEHDLAFKAERVKEFLEAHDKVLVSMRLRGRERAHVDGALQHIGSFAARFGELATVERGPERVGASRVTVLLKPRSAGHAPA